MANIDVAYLSWKSVKDDMIEYERIKVCKDAKPPLTDKAKVIMDKYKGKTFQDYVFPIFTVKHVSEKQKRERLERLYRLVNATLEKVRKKVRCDEKITWYAARGLILLK